MLRLKREKKMQILRIFIMEKRDALAVLSSFADLETDRNYLIVLVVSPPNALISGRGD